MKSRIATAHEALRDESIIGEFGHLWIQYQLLMSKCKKLEERNEQLIEQNYILSDENATIRAALSEINKVVSEDD